MLRTASDCSSTVLETSSINSDPAIDLLAMPFHNFSRSNSSLFSSTSIWTTILTPSVCLPKPTKLSFCGCVLSDVGALSTMPTLTQTQPVLTPSSTSSLDVPLP